MTSLTTMYAGQTNSPATTLAANITSSATSISVTDASALPAVPFPLTIGITSTSSETVLVTAKSGNTLTVTRGWDGTASAWNADTPCARVFTAKDLNTAQSNITALNTGKAEKTDVNNSIEQLYEDVFSPSASGSIANFERITGGMPVNSLSIAITPKQAGAGDPSPTNVRAITGWTGAKVFKAGRNLLDQSKYLTSITSTQGLSLTWNSDGSISFANTSTNTSAKVTQLSDPFYLPAGTYYFSGAGASANIYLRLRSYTNGTPSTNIRSGDGEFTLTEGSYVDLAVYIKAQSASGMTYSPMICAISGASYEPYSGSTTSISWNTEAGTVYGGTLNVTTGVLQLTHGYATFNGSENWVNVGGSYPQAFQLDTGITDAYQPAPIKQTGYTNWYPWTTSEAPQYGIRWQTNNSHNGRMYVYDNNYSSDLVGFEAHLSATNLQIVYPLDPLPDPIQLTPEQVNTLQGTNNIWADTGDVIEVTFGEDIKQYIDAENADKQDEIIVSGILKGDGAGGVSAAVAGTDYQAPLTAGTDYQTPLSEPSLQWYGVCSTSASTQAKTVSITGITALTEGLEIRVKMTNAQTYNGTPTLNVNSLGAKTIKQHGSTDAVRYQWQAGEILSLTYDGTYWVLENNSLATTTYFGLTRLSSAIDSTDESMAATPKAVKTAYDLAAAAVPATEKGVNVATLATVADSTTPAVPRITPAQSFAPLFTITADTTLAAKHAGGILVCTNSPTITIPSNVFSEATQIEILNYGTGVVTIAGASGCSVNGTSAGSVTLADQYKSAVLLAISASQWVVQGAIE